MLSYVGECGIHSLAKYVLEATIVYITPPTLEAERKNQMKKNESFFFI